MNELKNPHAILVYKGNTGRLYSVHCIIQEQNISENEDSAEIKVAFGIKSVGHFIRSLHSWEEMQERREEFYRNMPNE